MDVAAFRSFPAPAGRIAYDGADAAASYGDVAREWAAIDGGAALLDAGWRRFFAATGDERREFLHGQTTANVEALRAGDGAAAATLTAQGRPLATFALYETGERIWIATTAAHSAATHAALSRFLVADDCDFEDDVAARCLAIAGPGAAATLERAGLSGDALDLPQAGTGWRTAAGSLASVPVRVFSRGDLRVPVYEILVGEGDGDADEVARALVAAGATPAGVQALEIVRIESGTPRYGIDVDETRIVMEARLEWAIHFAKGCYVGQEVVERAVSRGRINHELCLLACDAEPPVGARVEGGSESDVVTSAAVSPRLGPVALAYLPRASTDPATSVTLRSGEGAGDRPCAATVLEWPRRRVLAGRG